MPLASVSCPLQELSLEHFLYRTNLEVKSWKNTIFWTKKGDSRKNEWGAQWIIFDNFVQFCAISKVPMVLIKENINYYHRIGFIKICLPIFARIYFEYWTSSTGLETGCKPVLFQTACRMTSHRCFFAWQLSAKKQFVYYQTTLYSCSKIPGFEF